MGRELQPDWRSRGAGDLLPRRDEEGRSHRSLCAGPAGTDALRRTVGRRGRPARSPGLPTAVGTLQRGVHHSTQGPVGHTRTSHHGGPLSAGCAPERSPAQLLQQKSRPQRREGGMAGPGGFEPPTLGSEVRHSIEVGLKLFFPTDWSTF